MIKVNVKSHTNIDADQCGHVNNVGLIHHGEDVILLDIDLKTKYKEVGAFGGATDEDVQSIWIGMDEVQLTLPPDFQHNVIYASTSRYTIHITIAKFKLWEQFSDSTYEDVILWESPDDES